ncbi:MAG: class I SAM-dependent DNA methyltransferase [Thermoanaerobaculia bacterium]
MSARPFSSVYASAYDALYEQKDYPAECDLLEEAFRRHGASKIDRVVDLGCGTGSHAILLAERGYRVVGVDRSPEMIRIAEAKARARRVDIRWVEGDLASVDAGEAFDAAISMFSVFGYFTADEELAGAFRNIHRHVRPGGLLCFDVWHGPAIEKQGVGVRKKTVSTPGGPVTRTTTARLLPGEHVCEVQFDVSSDESPEGAKSRETHRVRYFFEDEIRDALKRAGFELLSLTAFPGLDRPPGDSDWYAFCVARRAV